MCWNVSVGFKVWQETGGRVWGSVEERCGKVVLECGRGGERCGKVLGQMCLGVGEVRGDVGEVWGMWKSVGRGLERVDVGCLEVLGKVWESVLECGVGRGDVEKCVGMWGRCGEVL